MSKCEYCGDTNSVLPLLLVSFIRILIPVAGFIAGAFISPLLGFILAAGFLIDFLRGLFLAWKHYLTSCISCGRDK